MYTTIAFQESIDPAGAFVNIGAVPDPHIKTAGDFVYISEFNKVVGASQAGLGDAVAGHMRLQSPSLRRINPYYITPNIKTVYSALDVLRAFHPESAIPLDIGEGLECETDMTPTGAGVQTGVVFLAPALIAPITGDIRPVRFTINVAGAIAEWEFSEMTLIDDLPVGVYDIVGGRVEADEGIAFRFVPVGAAHRPGGMIVATDILIEPYCQRWGRMGVWCSFGSVQLPGVEVLFSAVEAKAVYQCYMDVIKRG